MLFRYDIEFPCQDKIAIYNYSSGRYTEIAIDWRQAGSVILCDPDEGSSCYERFVGEDLRKGGRLVINE